ncbi:DMT family transporter [Caminibacter mediatlanticus TB-2]|uniref:DMT family transporter n=1 Tax=Caminibacter mediatlanticus TB-2 TaxID=391592 RepID=A0ABX5V601_9BACT|nr:DMT family transporter [Caminibacter mediatlanticus]QCT93707.1 DMT family transporter [Caminibacter mediatlanticus TB-2]
MKKRGLIEMLGATFLWGSVPIMGIYSHLPSGVFVFFRVLFGAPFILYFAIKRGGIKEFFKLKPFWPLLLSGIMLGVNWVFFFWALNMTDVSTVVVIYYAGPIISILLASIFLKEKLTIYIILSSILAFLGVIISIKGGINFSKGAFIALLAAISYGLLGFFSKIATMYHRAVSVTAWQMIISIIITLPFLFLNEWHFTYVGIIIAIITGIFHTALALFLWYDALNYIKVSNASIMQYLDIVFAIGFAYLFLHQIPDIYQIIGAILIIFAGIIAVKH